MRRISESLGTHESSTSSDALAKKQPIRIGTFIRNRIGRDNFKIKVVNYLSGPEPPSSVEPPGWSNPGLSKSMGHLISMHKRISCLMGRLQRISLRGCSRLNSATCTGRRSNSDCRIRALGSSIHLNFAFCLTLRTSCYGLLERVSSFLVSSLMPFLIEVDLYQLDLGSRFYRASSHVAGL